MKGEGVGREREGKEEVGGNDREKGRERGR